MFSCRSFIYGDLLALRNFLGQLRFRHIANVNEGHILVPAIPTFGTRHLHPNVVPQWTMSSWSPFCRLSRLFKIMLPVVIAVWPFLSPVLNNRKRPLSWIALLTTTPFPCRDLKTSRLILSMKRALLSHQTRLLSHQTTSSNESTEGACYDPDASVSSWKPSKDFSSFLAKNFRRKLSYDQVLDVLETNSVPSVDALLDLIQRSSIRSQVHSPSNVFKNMIRKWFLSSVRYLTRLALCVVYMMPLNRMTILMSLIRM